LTRPFSGDDIVKQVKDKLDIVEVIGSYIELIPRGSGYVALCPFHGEKTPSFSVNRSGQFFHCFGCKKSGDAISFVMAMEGMDFVDALKMLGESCGVSVERSSAMKKDGTAEQKSRIYKILDLAARSFEENLMSPVGAEAREYLAQRRISQELISLFRIGYSSESWNQLKDSMIKSGFSEQELLNAGIVKTSDSGRTYDLFRNRLMLPIFDIQGRVLGFGGRVMDDSLPKYINSPESRIFHKSQLFYGLSHARRSLSSLRCAVIVEGYTDVIMAHNQGVENCIATLGTALTSDHGRLLKRITDRIILFYDGDDAGNSAAVRGIEILLNHDLDITVVTLDDGMDPYDFFSQNDVEDFLTFIKDRGKDFFDFALEQHSKKQDISTAGGRTNVARSLMKLADQCQDAIKKALLLKKIADTLGIPEDLLRKEYKASGSSNRFRSHSVITEKQFRPADLVKITSLEDDLIIGLLRAPNLIDEFSDELEAFNSEDEVAATVIKAIFDLFALKKLEVKELISFLRRDSKAMERVISLVSDPRKTDPKLLVTCAIDSLKNKNARREYEIVREQGRAILNTGGKDETDRHLVELTRKLKQQKGPKEKNN